MTANTDRSLTVASLRAALLANKQATLEEIAALPTAVESQKVVRFPLTCQYTGILSGSLTLQTTAGYLPLLSQWKQQQVLHPIFSLELLPLLAFSKNAWIRFCGFSQEEGENAELTDKQEQLLRVAALAMLHQIAEVRQDVPWLPEFVEVQNNWQSLISLSYWKAYLDSKRFSFPTVRISKFESSINLNAYLQTCWAQKKSYETTVNERIEEAKVAVAEKALIAIRDELAGKRPVSTKLLWRWFMANLPSRYSRDASGWMWELFTAKDKTIFEFKMADCDLFEDIFLSECPTGSSVSHAFLNVLKSKRTLLENHFETFEIIIPSSLQAAAELGEIDAVEPKLTDFPSKPKWMIAHAKWQLTHGSGKGKHREAAIAKQRKVSVIASYIPTLDTGRRKDFTSMVDDQYEELKELEAIDYIAPDSVAATIHDDSITGELED